MPAETDFECDGACVIRGDPLDHPLFPVLWSS
jgi:hypothetical protein